MDRYVDRCQINGWIDRQMDNMKINRLLLIIYILLYNVDLGDLVLCAPEVSTCTIPLTTLSIVQDLQYIYVCELLA